MSKPADEEDGKKGLAPTHTAASQRAGEVLPGYEERTFLQKLKLWDYQPEDKTTYWQYFKRPFFLFAFPNVVLVRRTALLVRHMANLKQAGIMFAFGCTAGIVSFNTSTSCRLSHACLTNHQPPYSLRNHDQRTLQLLNHRHRTHVPFCSGR
jgi:hypothetical protein